LGERGIEHRSRFLASEYRDVTACALHGVHVVTQSMDGEARGRRDDVVAHRDCNQIR
jgi:hypothetical protein